MLSAREVALRHLERVEHEGAFVGRLGPDSADPRTARLATDLVAGVTRWRRWLDFLIDHFFRARPDTLDDVLRQLLRIGIYELVIRETAPHAAVNEAVSLAHKVHHKGGAALLNGILRNVERARENLPTPDTKDEAERLGIQLSHPTWLVRRWLAAFGPVATESLLRLNNEPPRPCLRLNSFRLPVEETRRSLEALTIDVEETALDDFVRVSRLQPVRRAGLLKEGLLAVQDVAAGCVVRVLDPRPGERVLDAAAAPGGKSLYAAILMGDTGEVVALDVHPKKIELVDEAARAHGLASIRTLCADLRDTPPGKESGSGIGQPFDRVLLDAPCTGTGVLAKRADLRWRLTMDRLKELVDLQRKLLDAAARHVRPGGLLVYATCSIEEEENEEQVARFLERHPEYRREPIPDDLARVFGTPNGNFLALPHVHGTDGAFAARLRHATS